MDVLRKHPSADVRCRAVWTLAGLSDQLARLAIPMGLEDKDSSVRQAAVHVAGLNRDASLLPNLLRILKGDEPGPARAAAEAIGRLRDPTAVPLLLEAVENLELSGPDNSGAPSMAAERIREHALIYALIEIADAEKTREGSSNS